MRAVVFVALALACLAINGAGELLRGLPCVKHELGTLFCQRLAPLAFSTAWHRPASRRGHTHTWRPHASIRICPPRPPPTQAAGRLRPARGPAHRPSHSQTRGARPADARRLSQVTMPPRHGAPAPRPAHSPAPSKGPIKTQTKTGTNVLVADNSARSAERARSLMPAQPGGAPGAPKRGGGLKCGDGRAGPQAARAARAGPRCSARRAPGRAAAQRCTARRGARSASRAPLPPRAGAPPLPSPPGRAEAGAHWGWQGHRKHGQ